MSLKLKFSLPSCSTLLDRRSVKNQIAPSVSISSGAMGRLTNWPWSLAVVSMATVMCSTNSHSWVSAGVVCVWVFIGVLSWIAKGAKQPFFRPQGVRTRTTHLGCKRMGQLSDASQTGCRKRACWSSRSIGFTAGIRRHAVFSKSGFVFGNEQPIAQRQVRMSVRDAGRSEFAFTCLILVSHPHSWRFPP